MEQYTEMVENKLMEISPDDDNYKEELEEAVNNFRNFDNALDNFIIEKGYKGEANNVKAKIDYIQSRFDLASVDPIDLRNLKEWLCPKSDTEGRKSGKKSKEYFSPLKIKRDFLFRFCFAFQLSIKDSNEFFRKVCLQRSFDCHNITEVVYYYALSHQLSYQDTKELLNNVPKVEIGKINSENTLYTDSIIKEIDRFKNSDELLDYLQDHSSQFEYNNVRACKIIKEKWDNISAAEGLANKEKNKLIINFDNPISSNSEKSRSTWNIYLQILGLDKTLASTLGIQENRKIQILLKENKLIHPLAADSFPDRQGLEAILRNEHKSDELVRKILILLLFYEFWVKRALENATYVAKYGDTNRCHAKINDYLIEAGYPELYAGNPFDWIFMHSAFQNEPLGTFRAFIQELYLFKEDELIPKA